MQTANHTNPELRAIAFVPAIAWWALSLYLFTLPGSAFPKANWLDKVQADKWVHAFLFFVLVYLFLRPLKSAWQQARAKHFCWLVPVLALGYGIAIEFIQRAYIPNRSFDLGDIMADAAGCLLGAWWGYRQWRHWQA